MATPDHTPQGRGYDTSLIYFHHANDYWTSEEGAMCDKVSIVDLWQNDGPANKLNNSHTCSQDHQPASCKYEDEIFVEEVLAQIAAHDVTQVPFLVRMCELTDNFLSSFTATDLVINPFLLKLILPLPKKSHFFCSGLHTLHTRP